MKSSLARHIESNFTDAKLLKLESELWVLTGRKTVIDIQDLHDNDFKQKVISYSNNKHGKARK